MSDATLQAVEDAIVAHFKDTLRPDSADHDTSQGDRSKDVVVDWVVGYTVSGVVDQDGETVVGYCNLHIAPLGNPNAHVYLAQWVSEDIAEIMHPDTVDD